MMLNTQLQQPTQIPIPFSHRIIAALGYVFFPLAFYTFMTRQEKSFLRRHALIGSIMPVIILTFFALAMVFIITSVVTGYKLQNIANLNIGIVMMSFLPAFPIHVLGIIAALFGWGSVYTDKAKTRVKIIIFLAIIWGIFFAIIFGLTVICTAPGVRSDCFMEHVIVFGCFILGIPISLLGVGKILRKSRIAGR